MGSLPPLYLPVSRIARCKCMRTVFHPPFVQGSILEDLPIHDALTFEINEMFKQIREFLENRASRRGGGIIMQSKKFKVFRFK